MLRPLAYQALISYTRNGVRVTQSLYTGPHRKHADKAYATAEILARHGVLRDCSIGFFDGYKRAAHLEKEANQLHGC